MLAEPREGANPELESGAGLHAFVTATRRGIEPLGHEESRVRLGARASVSPILAGAEAVAETLEENERRSLTDLMEEREELREERDGLLQVIAQLTTKHEAHNAEVRADMATKHAEEIFRLKTEMREVRKAGLEHEQMYWGEVQAHGRTEEDLDQMRTWMRDCVAENRYAVQHLQQLQQSLLENERAEVEEQRKLKQQLVVVEAAREEGWRLLDAARVANEEVVKKKHALKQQLEHLEEYVEGLMGQMGEERRKGQEHEEARRLLEAQVAAQVSERENLRATVIALETDLDSERNAHTSLTKAMSSSEASTQDQAAEKDVERMKLNNNLTTARETIKALQANEETLKWNLKQ
eukprot:41362-Rhodomonas_salina.1